MQIKKCSKCGVEKQKSEFFRTGKHPSGKEKFRGDCKECSSKDTAAWRAKNRAHYNGYMGNWRTNNPDKIRFIDMKRNYGLTEERYKQMIIDQSGLCKICKKGPTGKRPLAIDHNHETGKVRGLLCYRCNQAIAILDNKGHLDEALEYLKSSN